MRTAKEIIKLAGIFLIAACWTFIIKTHQDSDTIAPKYIGLHVHRWPSHAWMAHGTDNAICCDEPPAQWCLDPVPGKGGVMLRTHWDRIVRRSRQ